MRDTAKRIAALTLLLLFIIPLCACGGKGASDAADGNNSGYTETEGALTTAVTPGAETSHPETETETETNEMEKTLHLFIDGNEVAVEWENNPSVAALTELASSPVTVSSSKYGGFEQVGSLGASLPRDDVQTTTAAGDIMLYSGDQIVIFYGSNSWAYTRLGKITGMTESQLEDILGKDGVTLTITFE